MGSVKGFTPASSLDGKVTPRPSIAPSVEPADKATAESKPAEKTGAYRKTEKTLRAEPLKPASESAISGRKGPVFNRGGADGISEFRPFFGIAGDLDALAAQAEPLKVSDDNTASRIRPAVASPVFNRSPHMRTPLKVLELALPQKERVGDKPEYNWMTSLLPQALMLVIMISILLITGVGSLVYTAPMYCVTILTGVLSHLNQKKKYKKKKETAEQQFDENLSDLQAAIQASKQHQAEVLKYEYPSIQRCGQIAAKRMAQLWRIRPSEDGFLDLRMGMGSVPTKVHFQSSHYGEEYEALVRSAAEVGNVPISCPIRKLGSVGLVGERQQVLNMVRCLTIQAAVNHSYDELKIAVFFAPEEKQQWEWMRWLPHTWSDDRQNRYIAGNREDSVRLCKELEDAISKRTGPSVRADGKQTHFLVIVGNMAAVSGELLMNHLTANDPKLGISAVFTAEDESGLCAGCNAVVALTALQGRWYPTADTGEQHEFVPDSAKREVCDAIARTLAPVRLAASAGSSKLPDSVTFMEGYGAHTVEELRIEEKWKKSDYGKSLAVPIGIRGNGDPFYFDINRKKDGPHGMVAGGTGSGKSDIVQSWILSMALHFKPTEVAFIIVDYKGDGLLAPFRKLPHLVGTISNLDHNVERNVAALSSEVNRRQLLFKECGAHNIEDYIEKFQHGEIDVALPYLIVVIDEFADFKANHPEFMPIVNAIYTKGASLGIYCLVLAQDAAAAANGSVIPVNSHFHWCMKVDSDDASTGMLGTHDAYTMTKLPGRGYVKIGNFEVYEKIQAFWSGAYYNPNRDQDTAKIPPIAKVAMNGTRSRLFAGTLVWEKNLGLWSSVKEIDEVVKYICSYAEKTDTELPAQIWQPPIAQTLYLDSLLPSRFSGGKWPDTSVMEVVLGAADDPSSQRQYILSYTLSKSGHISIQGGPESGKTTALTTAAMSLALRYAPDELELYLFDYDKWALNLVRNLPHVKGSTAAADPEDIQAIIQKIRDEINRRRVLFLKAGAISLEGYCDLGKSMSAIVILVDNISAAWEDSAALQDMLYEVAQKGAGYGVYLIATAPGTAFPYKLSGFFKTKLTLRQNERSDYNGIVGRSELTPENYPGRGLAKMDYPVEIQIALPCAGVTESERNRNTHDLVEEMRQAWNPEAVPTDAVHMNWRSLGVHGDVVLGIDPKMMDPICFLQSGKHCLMYSGMEKETLVNQLQMVLDQVSEIPEAELVLFQDRVCSLNPAAASQTFPCGDAQADAYITALMQRLSDRAEGRGRNEKGELPPIFLVIADWREFFEGAADETVVYLRDVVEMGQGLGVYLIAGGLRDGMVYLAQLGEKLTSRLLKQRHVILLGGSVAEHGLLQTKLSVEEERRPFGGQEACYILEDKAKQINLLSTKEG